jgi:hypothetical protein
MSHTRLLVAPTAMTGTDISGVLLLPPTVVTGHMTSDDRCYSWTHGTCVVATSPTVATSVLTLVAPCH